MYYMGSNNLEFIELSNLPSEYDLNTLIGALCSTIGLKTSDVTDTVVPKIDNDEKNLLRVYLNQAIDGKVGGVILT